jgi:hypothetical protein
MQSLGAGESDWDAGAPAKQAKGPKKALEPRAAPKGVLPEQVQQAEDAKTSKLKGQHSQKQWQDAVAHTKLSSQKTADSGAATATHWSQMVSGSDSQSMLKKVNGKQNSYSQSGLPHHSPGPQIPEVPKKTTRKPVSLSSRINSIEKDQAKDAKAQLKTDEKLNEKLEEKIQAKKFIDKADDKQEHLAERLKRGSLNKAWKNVQTDNKVEVKDKEKLMDLKMAVGLPSHPKSHGEVQELEM